MGPISETYRYTVRSTKIRGRNAIVEGPRIAVPTSSAYEDHRGEIDLLVARQMSQAPD